MSTRLLLLSFCASLFLGFSLANLTDDEIAVFRQNNFTIQDNGDSWTLGHHGVPDHGFHGGFGDNSNTPTVQNHSYEIPKVPTPLEEGQEGCLSLGPVAMAISGAVFFNPYTATGYNAVEGDCKETFDHCNGHPQMTGVYHYHQLPTCLYHGLDDQRDVLMGVAFDGYALYGPMDETGKNWTTAELDKCHGHVYKGRYVYRITMDFPYVMSCFHGVRSTVTSGAGQPRDPTDGRPRNPPADGRPRNPPADGQPREPTNGIQQPADVDSFACRAQESNWMMETCFANCENPGLGSCGAATPSPDNDNDPSTGYRQVSLVSLTVGFTVLTWTTKLFI